MSSTSSGGSIGRFLVLCGVVLVGAGVFSTTVGQGPAQDAPLAEAPDFALETLDGERFRLHEHRGEIVVLNFWATWCPPCRREIPDFVDLQREHGDEGLQFVGVALQSEAEVEAVETFVKQFGVNYPVGLDDGTIARKYGGVQRLPTTFIIGPDGNVRDRFLGIAQRSRLLSELEKFVEHAR